MRQLDIALLKAEVGWKCDFEEARLRMWRMPVPGFSQSEVPEPRSSDYATVALGISLLL